jgi:hypothetical protein
MNVGEIYFAKRNVRALNKRAGIKTPDQSVFAFPRWDLCTRARTRRITSNILDLMDAKDT